MQEIEIKFFDIDIPQLEEKLLSIGAIKTDEFFYQIRAFDFPGLTLAKEKHGWVRLRSDGTVTEFSYKQRIGVKSEDASIPDEGMEEYDVSVSNFEGATQILLHIGMIQKFHQEKKRIRYKKGEVEFDIDTWPLIPTYLEIEGPSMEAIESAARELGFDPKEAKVCSAMQAFTYHGVAVSDYSYLGFDKQIKREGEL